MKVKNDLHRTGIVEVTGLNPVEVLIYFRRLLFFKLLKLEQFTAMIVGHFHLQPQFKCKLFHIYFTSFHYLREI